MYPAHTFSQSAISTLKDTLTVKSKEFVIQNSSVSTRGFLINKGSGSTAFTEFGRNLQFVTGRSADFQLQGDSTYVNTYLINKSIKVWRNGLLQYTGVADGVKFNNTTGQITFYPRLINGDKIYIEALNGF